MVTGHRSRSTQQIMEDRNCCTNVRSIAGWLQSVGDAATSNEAAECCDNLRMLCYESGKDARLYGPAVQSCLGLMRSFAEERCVQSSGLLALAALCEKQQLSGLIGKNGGVHQLLNAWTVFTDDGAVVKNAIVTMRSLSDVERNREIFCTDNGIQKLTESLQAFSHRASIQKAAAALIANLCFENGERKQQVIRNNAVLLLIQCLGRFDTPNHFRLHTNTCLALRNISVDKSGCDEILDKDRDLTTILKVIEVSYSHSSTARESLGILLNLAVQRSTSLSQSCVETVMATLVGFLKRTLRYSSRYDECHEICFATVRGLVSGNHQQMSLDQRQEIFRVAVTHAKEYMSCKSPLSVTVVTNICMCIRVMLMDSENRRCFSETCGGPQTLVQCISFLSNRPLHVEHALVALGNAVFDSARGKEEVGQSDGIRIVHDVMHKHYYISSVAEACLLAIHGICSSDENNGKIATEVLLHDMCVRMMNTFRDNHAIQERGLASIVSLGATPDAVRELRNVSALEVAQAATKAYPFSKAIAAQETKIRNLVERDALAHGSKLSKRKKSLPLQGWKHFAHG